MIPFFAYPPEVRTIIYTTNAIESLSGLRIWETDWKCDAALLPMISSFYVWNAF